MLILKKFIGWERPNFFAPESSPAQVQENLLPYTFGRPGYFDHVRREAEATRNSVALFDQSSFSKLLLQGRDAERVLNRVAGNNMSKAPGSVIYTVSQSSLYFSPPESLDAHSLCCVSLGHFQ